MKQQIGKSAFRSVLFLNAALVVISAVFSGLAEAYYLSTHKKIA